MANKRAITTLFFGVHFFVPNTKNRDLNWPGIVGGQTENSWKRKRSPDVHIKVLNEVYYINCPPDW